MLIDKWKCNIFYLRLLKIVYNLICKEPILYASTLFWIRCEGLKRNLEQDVEYIEVSIKLALMDVIKV